MKITECCIVCFFMLTTTSLLAQDCIEYYNSAGCMLDKQRGYKLFSQSKSSPISVNDTIEFNIVFYGQKDYIFSLCTDSYLYPIHFRLLDQVTRDVLYDNVKDRYIESLNIGFDVTKSLAIQVNVLANQNATWENQDSIGCIGLLLQYRKY